MADKLEIITVYGAGDDNKVALWDRHPDHPTNGDAFVVNDGKPYKVANTGAVQRALGDKRLVKAKPDEEAKNRTARTTTG